MKLSRTLIALAVLCLPSVAFAADNYIYCGNLPGCGSGTNPAPIREFFSSVLILLATNIPAYAYALGVLVIMIGGAYILLSAGRDDWVTKGKSAITWAVIGIAATSFAGDAVTLIQVQTLGRIPGPDFILSINNTLISTIFDLLYIALLAVAVYSGMLMVLSTGKPDQFSKAQSGLFYSAIGAIVINLAWTIANAFATL